jgi:hypothetical protein
MSVKAMVAIFGVPTEENLYEEDNDLHLVYALSGIALFFGNHDGNFVLQGIEVSADCHCKLWGEKLFPTNRRQIEDLLKTKLISTELQLNPSPFVVHLEPDGGTRLDIDQLGMLFYFDREGKLQEVNWGVCVDTNSDEYLWPEPC